MSKATSSKDNGLAVAQIDANNGMSLRDYFAGQALIAIVTCDYTVGPAWQARWAYDLADSMMEARDSEATR